MTTVAEHLVEALVAAGVRRIYGGVGDSLNSIVNAVHHNKKIEWVHVRYEEAGAFAAASMIPTHSFSVLATGFS